MRKPYAERGQNNPLTEHLRTKWEGEAVRWETPYSFYVPDFGYANFE